MKRYADIDKAIDQVRRSAEAIGDECDPMVVECLISFLDNLPTEDVSPVRHGRYIRKSICFGHYWTCSECGEELINLKSETRFCPHCGALMVGEVDGL